MVKAIVDADLLRKVCTERGVKPDLIRDMVSVERNLTSKKERGDELKKMLEAAAQEEFAK